MPIIAAYNGHGGPSCPPCAARRWRWRWLSARRCPHLADGEGASGARARRPAEAIAKYNRVTVRWPCRNQKNKSGMAKNVVQRLVKLKRLVAHPASRRRPSQREWLFQSLSCCRLPLTTGHRTSGREAYGVCCGHGRAAGRYLDRGSRPWPTAFIAADHSISFGT
jgi:hypothetical protein